MKNKLVFYGIIAVTAIIVIGVSGCLDFFSQSQPQPQPQDTGTVYINLGGGVRTLLPTQIDLSGLYFVITLTQASGSGHHSISQDGQETVEVQLNAGAWNLDIRGHVQPNNASNASSAIVHYTQNGIIVAPGANVTINAVLTPNLDNMTQNRSGTFSYEITIPPGASGTLAVLNMTGPLLKPCGEYCQCYEGLIPVSPPIDLTQTVTKGSLYLDSGEYNIVASIVIGGVEKEWWALAHIYDGAVTRAVVGPDDFTDIMQSYGTLAVTLSIEDLTMIDEGRDVFSHIEQPIVLDKDESTNITVSADGLDVLAWRVGSIVLGTGNNVTLNAEHFNTGSYSLYLTFAKDGRAWQSSLAFIVRDKFSLSLLPSYELSRSRSLLPPNDTPWDFSNPQHRPVAGQTFPLMTFEGTGITYTIEVNGSTDAQIPISDRDELLFFSFYMENPNNYEMVSAGLVSRINSDYLEPVPLSEIASYGVPGFTTYAEGAALRDVGGPGMGSSFATGAKASFFGDGRFVGFDSDTEYITGGGGTPGERLLIATLPMRIKSDANILEGISYVDWFTFGPLEASACGFLYTRPGWFSASGAARAEFSRVLYWIDGEDPWDPAWGTNVTPTITFVGATAEDDADLVSVAFKGTDLTINGDDITGAVSDTRVVRMDDFDVVVGSGATWTITPSAAGALTVTAGTSTTFTLTVTAGDQVTKRDYTMVVAHPSTCNRNTCNCWR